MELNYRERVARVTIVYYGPAASGKTTNLQVLHTAAQSEHRGDLVSVNSSQGRTILFDMLPLRGLGLAGWEMKFRLLAVPGQPAFKAARHLAMRGADAVVFVANSADDRQQDNPESLRDLSEAFAQHHIDPRLTPMVFQYNKQDLPEVMSPDEMDRQFNPHGVPSLPSVACRGEGVLETLAAIVERATENISRRYQALALPSGTPAADWTRDNILRAFGTLTLAGRGTGGAPAPGHGDGQPDQEAREAPAGWRVVRVGVPETRAVPEADRTLPPHAPGRLVGPYAQASVALGQAVEDLREQRDEARRFLEDLQHTLAAVEALAVEHEPESGFRALLARMAASGRCGRASLLTPGRGGTLRTTATLTPGGDVLASLPGGAKIIASHLLRPALFVLSNPKVPPDLKAALEKASPPVHALVSVPLRNVNSFHAVFLLYFGGSDPLPSARELAHLDWMGRGLSASLHARRSLAQAREGWSAARGAVVGEAARRVLGEIGPLLSQGGGGPEQGDPGDDPRARADAARLVSAVRLLERGQLAPRPESLDLVLNGLHGKGVEIGGDPGLVVPCETSLLRLALAALVEMTVEGGAGPARVTARRLSDGFEISFRGSGAVPAPRRSDTRWLLASRVAELHSGQLETAARADAPAFTLRLPLP